MIADLIEQALADPSYEAPLSAIPYANFLGLRLVRRGGVLHAHLPFGQAHIGGPERLHGGVTGAVMEFAGMLQLLMDMALTDSLPDALPKPVGLTVDYLRAGLPQDLWARADVVRRGRRIATMRAQAWQQDRARPIATAQLRLLMPDGKAG